MDAAGNGNAEVSSDPITVTGKHLCTVAVTAMAAPTTVGGSTNIEVTLSATDNDAMTVWFQCLAEADFAVMEGDSCPDPY